MNKSQNTGSRVTTPRANSSPRTPNTSRVTTPTRANSPRATTPRTPVTAKTKGIFFSETTDDIQEPSAEDVEEQARRLGVDIDNEPHLLQLIIDSLLTQVPPPWKPCFDATKKAWYYYNQDTYKSQWEHPADPIYRDKIRKAREDQAMNLMQNVDTRMAKPLKSLPPLKKSGKAMNLEPMPQLKELRKLGPIPKSMTPPMESALGGGLRSLSLNPPAFKSMLQPNDRMGLKPEDETERKHFNKPRDETVQKNTNSNVIAPAPKKSGLRLTGAGSAFMKREKSEDENNELSPPDVKPQIVPNPKESKENSLVGKPFKSILVNSISSKSESTNKKWNVDLDSLKVEEQSVWNQIHNESRASTVKFKLDEDTELHFETSLNENLENGSEESKETTDQETEEDEESEDDEDEESETDVSQSHVSMKKEGAIETSAPSNQSSNKGISTSASASSSTTTIPLKPESKPETLAPIKKMELKPLPVSQEPIVQKADKIELKQSRSEPIKGKSLEETIMELNREREEAVKRTQAELEKQKKQDLVKAREEIENILKLEMDKIKADFQIKIQTKRAELLHQHNQELSEAIETLKNQQQQQILQIRAEHTAALQKMRAEAEKQFALEKATIRQEIQKTFEEEKEELKRKLVQENEFELSKIKFELEQKKGTLELELQTSIENLEQNIKSQLDSANVTEAARKEEENRALELKDKELQELRLKYERLESKYSILKKQIQILVENEKTRVRSTDTISKSQSEKLYARRQTQVDISFTKDGDLVLSDNEDSANESDHEAATSSVSIDQQKSNDEDKFQEEPQMVKEIESRDVRLNSALKSIEDIKQQILALSRENEKEKAQLLPKATRKQNTKLQKLTRVRNSQTEDPQFNSSKNLQKRTYPDQINQDKDSSTQLPNKDLVEEAKDFIRSQRHRLSQPSESTFTTPIATTLGVKQRLAMEMKRSSANQSPKSKSKNIPPFLNLDHRDISETESSGVGSWKDMQSIQKKKVSEEIDHICQSLSALDGQMKEMWSMVRDGSGKSQGINFPTSGFNKTEDFAEQKYGLNQPVQQSPFPAQFSLPERQSLPGTIDQIKQMWTARDANNQGDTFGINHEMSYDNHILSHLNSGRSTGYNFMPPTESGLLSTMNPNIFQFKHVAFDNTLNNFLPVRGNTTLLVETLDEEIKQFREKQQQLVDEFAPQRDMTTDSALHERTKHLREWLDKF